MKKLAYIAIAAVWLLIFVFVGVSYFNAPSEDQWKGAMSFADVLKNYIDERPIDPNSIEDIGSNTRFAKVTAEIFKAIGEVEKPVNEHYNFVLSAKDPVSLANQQASAQKAAMVKEFIGEAAKAHEEREILLQKYVTEIRKIPLDGLIFPVEPLAKSIADDKPNREEYTRNLIAVATYVDYLLQFIEARRAGGYFTIENGAIKFTIPDDQKYYSTLISRLDEAKREIGEHRQKEKSGMEATINGIRKNKKNDS